MLDVDAPTTTSRLGAAGACPAESPWPATAAGARSPIAAASVASSRGRR